MSQLQCNSIVPIGGIPAGASGGGIIQCVQATSTATNGSSYSGSTWQTILSASITPRSTSNKILIFSKSTIGNSSTGALEAGQRVIRGVTVIDVADALGSRIQASSINYVMGSAYNTNTAMGVYIDSPATTSSTTYNLQFYCSENQAFYVNYAPTNAEYSIMGTTTLVLMEVSG